MTNTFFINSRDHLLMTISRQKQPLLNRPAYNVLLRRGKKGIVTAIGRKCDLLTLKSYWSCDSKSARDGLSRVTRVLTTKKLCTC